MWQFHSVDHDVLTIPSYQQVWQSTVCFQTFSVLPLTQWNASKKPLETTQGRMFHNLYYSTKPEHYRNR